MKDYKYSLRKGSQKEICPECGLKRFVPYVDTVTGDLLDPSVGRCDRENNCQYHLTPKQFFKQNDDIRNYNKKNRKPQRLHTQLKEPEFIDYNDLLISMKQYNKNSLSQFLHTFFDEIVGVEEVDDILKLYCVGTSAKFGKSPIFWLIDSNGRIRDGKIMGYNSETGKRIKEPFNQITNVHSVLEEKYQGNFKPCYFGSHILATEDKLKNLPIWLFESEKTALIVALAMVWGGTWLGVPIATSGADGFNPTLSEIKEPFNKYRILKNKTVVLFPDNGMFDKWEVRGKHLYGYSNEVWISTAMERELHPVKIECEFDEGDGLDDLIMTYFNNGFNVADLLLTSFGYKGEWKLF